MLISSTHNPRIKALLQLTKPAVRKAEGVFVVEGIREVERASLSGYEMTAIYRDCSLFPEKAWAEWYEHYASPADITDISRSVFNRLAYREDNGGLLAVFRQKSHLLKDLRLKKTPLLLILEAIEKPGNLGALLRTADAAALDGVIVCDTRTDLYNPNVIRSSIGCLFSVQVAIAESEEVISWLKDLNINIYATTLQAASPYHLIDYREPAAIVMGTEDQGLSVKWVHASTGGITIPMQGIADSLNVSVSAAIVIFEACRQRTFAPGH